MNYKKKYEEAERLYQTANADQRYVLESLFPKLRESEDERIRKEILEYVKNTPVAPEGHIEQRVLSRWLAWLEKQGEQNESDVKDYNSIDPHFAKPIDKVEPKFKVGDYVVGKYISGYISEVRDDCYLLDYQGFSIDKQDNYHLWTIADAKDGDVLVCPFPKGYEAGGQIFIFKEINSRDYVDNCIEYYCRVCEGVFYENKNGYMGTTSSPLYPATKEQRDLLFAKMKEAGYEWDAEKKELKKIDNEEVNGEDYGIDGLWHAQRILEKTLGCVDGYQTDDGILDHKAAITAVKKLYKQKTSEWSEEDSAMTEVVNLAHESDILAEIERIINRRLNLLQGEYFNLEEETKDMTNELIDTLCSIEPTIEVLRTEYEKGKADAIAEIQKGWSEEDESHIRYLIECLEYCKKGVALTMTTSTSQEYIDWLKSLRPQKHWKPTIAQVKAVEEALNDAGYTYDDLKSLYDDLKKL